MLVRDAMTKRVPHLRNILFGGRLLILMRPERDRGQPCGDG